MKYTDNIKKSLLEMYKSKSYLALTVVFGLIIFSFNALISNYKILISDFSLKLLFSLLAGTSTAMPTVSFIFLITMSVLAGIVLSMSIFLLRRQIKGSMGFTSSGILVSIVAPACPSCAIGLLSVLGLGGFLTVLPFKGVELGVMGIILLVFSIGFLSGKIVTKTCAIK